MKKVRMLPIAFSTLLLPLVQLACGPSKLADRKESEAAQGKNAEIMGPSPQSISTTDAAASEPVAVAGSYLTCQLEHEGTDLNVLAIGCSMDMAAISSPSQPDLKFDFKQGTTVANATSIAPASMLPSSDTILRRYKWNFKFNRSQLTAGTLHLSAQTSNVDKPIVLATSIDILPSQPQAFFDVPAHISTDSAAPLTGCAAVERVTNLTPDVSLLNFEITSANATIEIHLKGICGISSDDTSNTLVLVNNSGGPASTWSFGREMVDRVFTSNDPNAASYSKGSYSLKFLTPSSDNFRVDQIIVVAKTGFITLK